MSNAAVDSLPRVGFAGIGRMGAAMARRLLDAGYPLTVWNRTAARCAPLVADGAAQAGSPEGLAASVDVLVTMVADGEAARELLVGGGALAAARPGLVVIEMSTIGPVIARELADAAAERGATLLDAPVSGSVASATSGALTTVVGGERDAFERVRPVLAAMAAQQLWLGPSGAGAAMKLALNGMIAITAQAVGEALAVAEGSGIAPELAYGAIEASAVGSPFVAYKREAFLEPESAPVAFSLALMQKDLVLALAQARSSGVPVPLVAAADQSFTAARALAGDEADLARVADLSRTALRQEALR
ncbi:MAG TPA: NAD(P)-dependent oxidoreductase [Conexibacter sp.]|jgi:3-hydroxyisobutyrate dehydrogenase-like beta-hydroxyacid dehydrogenase